MENQDPNQITPSTPEQVQVVQGEPATPPAEPVAPVAPDALPTSGTDATGYDAFTDDDFKAAYATLCAQMGREFGIRHDLVTEGGITDTSKFTNVLVVAKKE